MKWPSKDLGSRLISFSPCKALINTHTPVFREYVFGFCNQNADKLGSLAGIPFPAVYVGIVVCARASTYICSSTHRFPEERVRGCARTLRGAREHSAYRSFARRQSEPTRAARAVDDPCAHPAAGPAANLADLNSSACAVDMSVVGKSQDTAWKDVLDPKGLSAAAPILEQYGLSCEPRNDMSLLDEDSIYYRFRFLQAILSPYLQVPN